MRLHILAHRLELDAATESLIRRSAAELSRQSHQLSACQVVVEGPPTSREARTPYRVRIDLTVAGEELVVGRQEGFDLTAVIQAAFAGAHRRLLGHSPEP